MRTKKLFAMMALMLAMAGTGYASLSDTSAAGLKAACEIVSIVIE